VPSQKYQESSSLPQAPSRKSRRGYSVVVPQLVSSRQGLAQAKANCFSTLSTSSP
jgi:hypothetical protein